MFRKLLRYGAAVLLFLLLAGTVIYLASGPQPPAPDSGSAAWLQPGPFRVAQADFSFVDTSRSTAAHGDQAMQDRRRLPTTLWYPLGTEAVSLPLVVHSHGILSSRSEMLYLMEALASRGYVVAAADYPLTSGATPGGAQAADVFNQPADVSFLIDSVLALKGENKPFHGSIDAERIALTGYSLGGLTTLLSTFHARLQDPRINAAVAIAAPSAVFAENFFETTTAPVLAIAGTADALIEYQGNAADLPTRSSLTVVGIEAGSHLGFIGAAEPLFRFMENPDSLGCSAVLAALGESPNALYDELGSPAIGIDNRRDIPDICAGPLQPALHPGRQQMITEVAVLAFLESVFNADAAQRRQAATDLQQSLARDFQEVRLLR